MGSQMLLDICFATSEQCEKFKLDYKIESEQILEELYDHVFNSDNVDVVIYMGYMGHEDPKELLEKLVKDGYELPYFAYLPISDRNSCWEILRDE